ncbi:MAG: hypothetical protein IKN55_09205 [Oscillospiraceae bacterium]|nr:hypothetical protein [Oscillospiraceae bacterium]
MNDNQIRFLSLLDDDDFRQSVSDAASIEDLQALLAKRGCTLSADELDELSRQAAESLMETVEGEELSDDELENVAGGTGGVNVNQVSPLHIQTTPILMAHLFGIYRFGTERGGTNAFQMSQSLHDVLKDIDPPKK